MGWMLLELASGIHVGKLPLYVLKPGEFVLFVSYVFGGFALPVFSFFMLLLDEYDLQLQHLTPTPSFRWPSLSTYVRCLWGAPLHSSFLSPNGGHRGLTLT